MGRVARYKKIRTCDPFSKKNGGRVDLSTVGIWGLGDNGRKLKKKSRTAERLKSKVKKAPNAKGKEKNHRNNNNNNNNKSVTSDGFDLPPDQADEFDLNDLTGSVQKQRAPLALMDDDESGKVGASSNTKNTTKDVTSIQEDKVVTSTGNIASIPKTDQDEAKVNRLLKLDKQVADKEERRKMEGHARMEGESKRAYARRTKAETRQLIKKTTTIKNVEKLQRKKEFLKNKKKNKKGGRGTFNAVFDDDGGNNYDRDMDRRSQSESGSLVVTGERALAAVRADPVRFGEQADRPPVFRQLPRGARQSKGTDNSGLTKADHGKSKGLTDAQVAEEQDAMEMMRRRIQTQYAAIKLKRRQKGDFHL